MESRPPLSRLAISSLVLGILSTPPFPFGLLAGIPAIVCGHKALTNIKGASVGGRGVALTGVALGYLSVLESIVLIVLILTGILKP